MWLAIFLVIPCQIYQSLRLNLSFLGSNDYCVPQTLRAVSPYAQRNSKSVGSLFISAEFRELLGYEDFGGLINSLNL